MTIQIKLYKLDGSIEKKNYQKVARHNYSAYVAGFFANKDFYPHGEMIQLKGKERLILHSFGRI